MSDRKSEQLRYTKAYQNPDYKMGNDRLNLVSDMIHDTDGDLFLDVGCGRGELLDIAEDAGYLVARGLEVVPSLLNDRVNQFDGIHRLPYADSWFDLVTCCDVLEHVLEEDALAGISEMIRVASKTVILTVAWSPSTFGSPDGKDLHITKHDSNWWLDKIKLNAGVTVTKYDGWVSSSAMFEIKV